MPKARATIHEYLAAHRADATRFLAELVKVPSDNPHNLTHENITFHSS